VGFLSPLKCEFALNFLTQVKATGEDRGPDAHPVPAVPSLLSGRRPFRRGVGYHARPELLAAFLELGRRRLYACAWCIPPSRPLNPVLRRRVRRVNGVSEWHEDKAALRRACLSRRRVVPGAGDGLRDVILREIPPPPGALVGGFWPMGSEIDPRPLLEALHARGHRISLPVTPPRGQPLSFRRWLPGTLMARGPMGTQHPAKGDAVTPDWLIVPLLAFDRSGARLGYGGGYYDRTLALLRDAKAIGVAYAAQEIAQVPTGPHDVRLPAIATEQGLIRA